MDLGGHRPGAEEGGPAAGPPGGLLGEQVRGGGGGGGLDAGPGLLCEEPLLRSRP